MASAKGIANLVTRVGNPQLPRSSNIKKHRTRGAGGNSVALLMLAAIVAAFVFLLRSLRAPPWRSRDKRSTVAPSKLFPGSPRRARRPSYRKTNAATSRQHEQRDGYFRPAHAGSDALKWLGASWEAADYRLRCNKIRNAKRTHVSLRMCRDHVSAAATPRISSRSSATCFEAECGRITHSIARCARFKQRRNSLDQLHPLLR